MAQERIPCPKCGKLKPLFAIRDGMCGEDRLDEARERLAEAQRAQAKEAETRGRFVPLTWNDIRGKRAIILQRCDYTQLMDVKDPDRKAWATYRQTLRDLPQTYTNPEDVVWPTPPSIPHFKTAEDLG